MPNREIDGDIEGFGMVFLEANAAGKPVIGGVNGGTADAIVDGVTGLRVDGARVEAIATAAIQLLSDQETAHRMGEQGYHRVQEAFHWDAIVQHTRVIASTLPRASR